MCGVCGCGSASAPASQTGDSASVASFGDVVPKLVNDVRRIEVERDLFAENDRLAAANRALLRERRALSLNLLSSPGSGKTSLLLRTLRELSSRMPLAVIEGDQQTRIDAERIEQTGVPAVQINTGKLCHLDAAMIAEAFVTSPPPTHGVVFIENVGNLVCPAGFDLGEAAKVVLVSVTEGEDKPLKYPDMFHAAKVVLVTKIDLLPHLDFNPDALISNVKKVNHLAACLPVSAKTGEGLGDWYGFIEARRAEALSG